MLFKVLKKNEERLGPLKKSNSVSNCILARSALLCSFKKSSVIFMAVTSNYIIVHLSLINSIREIYFINTLRAFWPNLVCPKK
jgi:hypothetical protein